MRRIDDEKRAAIVASLQGRLSVGQAAKLHGVSKSTVSTIARQVGLPFERSHTKKASAVHREYARERRLELWDEVIETTRQHLRTCTAKQIRDVVMALAVATDKRRQEEQAQQSRYVEADFEELWERGQRRVDYLAAREQEGAEP